MDKGRHSSVCLPHAPARPSPCRPPCAPAAPRRARRAHSCVAPPPRHRHTHPHSLSPCLALRRTPSPAATARTLNPLPSRRPPTLPSPRVQSRPSSASAHRPHRPRPTTAASDHSVRPPSAPAAAVTVGRRRTHLLPKFIDWARCVGLGWIRCRIDVNSPRSVAARAVACASASPP
jgi:hypothetical protein